jgi:hypothetical protein
MTYSSCHEKFYEWTVKQGVKVHNGIKAEQIPGKGYGIVALTSLKVQSKSLGSQNYRI